MILIAKNQFQRFGQKTSFFMCRALPKTQKSVVMLRDSSSGDTSNVATGALMTHGVSLLIFKKILFWFPLVAILLVSLHCGGGIYVWPHGLWRNIKYLP